MRSLEAWQALKPDVRRTALCVGVLTNELGRAPSAEEINEGLYGLDQYLPTTTAQLRELVSAGFVQESDGSWQVHPTTLRLLARAQWKWDPPAPVLKNDRFRESPFEGVESLVPWWYGDTARVLTASDNFRAIGAVPGDVVLLRTVLEPDSSCFQLYSFQGDGLELRPWREGDGRYDGTRVVAHLRLFGTPGQEQP